jgi:hypothetical protein
MDDEDASDSVIGGELGASDVVVGAAAAKAEPSTQVVMSAIDGEDQDDLFGSQGDIEVESGNDGIKPRKAASKAKAKAKAIRKRAPKRSSSRVAASTGDDAGCEEGQEGEATATTANPKKRTRTATSATPKRTRTATPKAAGGTLDLRSAFARTAPARGGTELAAPPVEAEATAKLVTPPAEELSYSLIGVPPPTRSESFLCNCCYEPIPDITVPGVRLMSKQKLSFRCGKCNCKQVVLRRKFGSWPIAGFELFTRDQQAAFFSNNKDSSSGALSEILINFLSKRKIELLKSSWISEFQPLKVWEQRGYDSEMISDTATEKDKEMHPRLGLTFALQLHVTEESKVEETVREEVMKAVKDGRGKPNKTSRAHAIADDDKPQKKVADAITDDDESSDKDSSIKTSSSSSSSSDSRKKRKKDTKKKKKKRRKDIKKKTKDTKDKKVSFKDTEKRKLKEKLEKHKQQEADKIRLKQQRDEENARLAADKKQKQRLMGLCTKVIGKSRPLGARLDRILEDSRITDVPKAIVMKTKKAKNKLTDLEKLAEKRISGDKALTESESNIMGEHEETMSSAAASLKEVEEYFGTLHKHMK